MATFIPKDTLTIKSGGKKILRLEVSEKKNKDFYLYAEIQDSENKTIQNVMINDADAKDIKDFLRKYF